MENIENLTPNLGCETNEPSLREMVSKYYHKHFVDDVAEALTKRYFTALDHLYYMEKYRPDYPDYDVSG